VRIKVKGQDGLFVGFKIEKTTLLKTLIEAYCTCRGLEVKRICLFLDGKQVRETQTPAELDLQDDDVMEAQDEHVMEAECEKGHYDYEKAQKPSERDRSAEINLSMVCKLAAIDVMQHLMDRIARFDLTAAKNIVALMQHSPLSAADEIINALTSHVKEMARSHTQLTFEEDQQQQQQQQKAEETSAQEASAPRPSPFPSPSGCSASSRASPESCRQRRRSSCSVIDLLDSIDGPCPNAECVAGELKMRVAGVCMFYVQIPK
jgi:small ubiquitin-related modifier